MKPEPRTLLFSCLLVALLGCESTESSNIYIGNIIADIEAYRLTSITETETVSNVEFVVILRAGSGDRPYLRLSGGDELNLIVDDQFVSFTREDDDVTDVIRYLAAWTLPIATSSTFTVRFIRGSGATYDSSVLLNPAPVITEPAAGFEWSPDIDDLTVNWGAVEPPVDNGAVVTSCTRYYSVLDTSGLTFTVPEDALVRTDTSTDICPGYVELTQETIEGAVSPDFDDESEFLIDQVTQISVTAQY